MIWNSILSTEEKKIMKKKFNYCFKRISDKIKDFIFRYNLGEHKKKIIVITLLFCIVLTSFIIVHNKKESAITKAISEKQGEKANENTKDDLPDETKDESIIVDIDGAVEKPTMVELPGKSRLDDAIKAAGGLSKNADTTKINRAEVLRDGQKIYIPKKGETNYENKNGSVTGKSGKKVNINSATDDELRTVKGIGPSMSEKILNYREKNGPFKKIEDLKKVDGIGEKTYEKIKNYLTI